jgi:glucokinase
MTPEALQPTPYPDVNEALREILVQAQTILGSHFVGMYLSGSLALGDFNPQSSDIDLVIVTDGMLSDDLFAALQDMHAHFAAGCSPWSGRLEAVYIPEPALRHDAWAVAEYPVLEKGRALAKDHLESAWSVQRYTLRKHGLVVAGPEPCILVDSVDPDDMRRAGSAIAGMWLEQARSDPSWLAWLRRRNYQPFVVLTLCRLLYTLERGAVASKPGAARWAQQALGPRWAGLIERALAGQQDSTAIPNSDADETVALIQHTVDRFRQWEASAYGKGVQQRTRGQSVDARTCAIGLDVGGTKIAAGIVALNTGRVLSRKVIATRAERGGEAVLKDAVALAESLAEEASASGRTVRGIGVGVAELVDQNGEVTSGHTIDWRGMPVRERFSRLAPALVEADVRTAALAEALFGSGRPFSLFVYVTVGTGISCCLVQEGRPYAGAHGSALIFASSPLTTTCTQCGTVLKPVLEEFASGPALVTRCHQQGATAVERGEDVVAAAAVGDPIAVEVVRTAGDALGASVGFLVNVMDPEAVIVGGGAGLAGGLYWDSFVRSAREHIWADGQRDLPILMAGLGADAGLIGAAAGWLRAEGADEKEGHFGCQTAL